MRFAENMCTDIDKAIHFLEAGGWDDNVLKNHIKT
jgi:hypothetical protein